MTFKREVIPALIVLMGVLHMPTWLVSEAFRPGWIVLVAKLAMHVTLAAWVFQGSRVARIAALLDPLAVLGAVLFIHDIEELPAQWMLSASLANALATGLVAFGPPHAWQQIAGACIGVLAMLPNIVLAPYAWAMVPPSAEAQATCSHSVAKFRRIGLEPLSPPYEHVPAGARAYVDGEARPDRTDSEMTILMVDTLQDAFGRCYPANRRLELVVDASRASDDSVIGNEPTVGMVADGIAMCHCQTVDLSTLTFMIRLITYP